MIIENIENLKAFAFISRHVATDAQIRLAAEKGIRLMSIMDMDGFTITPAAVQQRVGQGTQIRGVIVAHTAAALNLLPYFDVGVFENGNRAEEGKPPTFEAVALHIWRRDEGYDRGFNNGMRWANDGGN
jgi:hypothetical protein